MNKQDLIDRADSLINRLEDDIAVEQYQLLCEELCELLHGVSSVRKDIERRRDADLAPIKEQMHVAQERYVEDFFKINEYEYLLKNSLVDMIEIAGKVQQDLYQLSKEAQEKKDFESVKHLTQKAASATLTLPKGIYTRQIPDIEVEDISKVPIEYLKINRTELLVFLADESKEIPGIKRKTKLSVGVREEK